MNKDSGSGGFNLLGESDLPLDLRLDTDDGRKQLLDKMEERLRGEIKDAPNPQPMVNKRRQEAEELLKQLEIFPIRINAGDDASCLNLYQPTRPQLLGLPQALLARRLPFRRETRRQPLDDIGHGSWQQSTGHRQYVSLCGRE